MRSLKLTPGANKCILVSMCSIPCFIASIIACSGFLSPIHHVLLISMQIPYEPIKSVSKAIISLFCTILGPHSWNHGLVLGPDANSLVSIHSPPRFIFSACKTAQISFSDKSPLGTPSLAAISISDTAVSHA